MTGRSVFSNPLFWLDAWIAFMLSTAFLWIIWYLAIFTPVHIERSKLEVSGRDYAITIWSHKTVFANTLCGKPTSAAAVSFQDAFQNHVSVADNVKGHGNGDEQVRKWVSTGRIPSSIKAGPVVAWKRLLYLCAGGIVKEVETPEHPFILGRGDEQ